MNKILKFWNRIMSKNFDYKKERVRGTIKQIMKVRGLRSISLANYNKWAMDENPFDIHSLKIDIQNGYLYLYKKNEKTDRRCGNPIESPSLDMYNYAYNEVNKILKNEKNIPSSIKRNILVKVSR